MWCQKCPTPNPERPKRYPNWAEWVCPKCGRVWQLVFSDLVPGDVYFFPKFDD